MTEFTPFKHQGFIIDKILENDYSMVFAGMGLGKSSATLQALDYRFARGELHSVVIVAPIRVAKLTWPAEIKKWAFSRGYRVCDLRPALLAAKTKKQKSNAAQTKNIWNTGQAEVYLLNYDLLPKLVSELIDGRDSIYPNAIVFDEIHNAKNPSSIRIKKMRTQMRHFDFRIGLTGTPQPNGYIDLFAMFRLLDNGDALDHRITYYKSKFFYNPDGQGFKWVLREGAKEQIENQIAHMTVTLSSEEWLKIPEVETNDIEVTLPTAARRKYDELEKEFLTTIGSGDIPAVSAAALSNKLLQLASGSVYDEDGLVRELHDVKIKALKKLVAERKELKETLLIVCFYDHEMDRITRALPQAVKFREEDVDSWNRGEIPVWVAKYTAISEGLNLQMGGYNICWFVPTYSHMYFTQLNARLARTGQTHRTTIHRIIAKDTADEAAIEALRYKEQSEKSFMASMRLLESMREPEIPQLEV